jgi:hypothetical protein
LLIASYSWTPSANFYQELNPWTEFFENPRVANRITNFYLLRCKLHVKVIVNGNGFYYGRMIVAYTPLPDLDDFSISRGFLNVDNVGLSQKPHIYIDPTNSMGGSLELPFFWDQNALSIPNGEWRQMGKLDFHVMNELKAANGATDPLTVSVFAWATDVSLSVPTARDSAGIAPQIMMKSEADEYGSGPISKPASIVSGWGRALATAPIIGPYARATEIAAGALAAIATMFGYSRPAVLDDIVPYRPTYVGNMANTNVPDSTTKLSLDAKQEVTVDPRTVGLSDSDEMTITSISMRESYLTQCVWGQSGVAAISAPGDVLFSSYVSPMLWAVNTGVPSREEIHLPACAFAALPFKYWRGTMKFRFQVVASNFHKGRLRVSYDPIEPNIKAHEFNTNYTWIIDIAEQKDFVVEIGWGNQFPFCLHTNPGSDELPYRRSIAAGSDGNGLIGPTFSQYTNGYIGISVLNELTVPSDAADINAYINVFVSTGPDFEVANPTAENIADYAYFQEPLALTMKSESNEMTSGDCEETDNPSRPLKPQVDASMASKISKNDGITAACVGEVIASFRQCLKRYMLHTVHGTFTSLTDGDYYYTRVSNHFPFYRGYAPGAINKEGSLGRDYNYAKSTLLNYLTPAFTGWRGAIRYKTIKSESMSTTELGYKHGYMRYVRTPDDSTVYKATFSKFLDAAGGTNSITVFDNLSKRAHGWEGQHMTVDSGNPVLEVEFPYINDIRFVPAKLANKTSVTGVDDSWHTFESTVSTSDLTQVVFEDQVSVGEDFTLFFFTGAPILYYYPTDPAP